MAWSWQISLCLSPALSSKHSFLYGKPLPSFSWLIEKGKMCALNFPTSLNAGLARILDKMLKLDSQHAGLAGIPEIERNKQKYFRQVFCMCNEYQPLPLSSPGMGDAASVRR